MKTFLELKRNLKKNADQFKQMRIAVLGNSATQFLTQALVGACYEEQIKLSVWEADYDQIQQTVLDVDSNLYRNKPDVVLIYWCSEKLSYRFNKCSEPARNQFADDFISEISELVSCLEGQGITKVMLFNLIEFDDAVFGNYANKLVGSWSFQLRKMNYMMMELAAQRPSLHICDIQSIQNRMGRASFFQASLYVNSDLTISLEALPAVAYQAAQLLRSMIGRSRKCLILDLDNTTWGGIIGDDGWEHIQIGSLGIGKAFTELQWWAKKLQQRGIILTVCSKNFEHIAKVPFEKHPDMVLRLSDIAVFIANWDNKADNIRQIQEILNIGFDSMVFLDDNPMERDLVRSQLPDVAVPELPVDPANYVQYLTSLNLFDTISYSSADQERTKQYQVENERLASKRSFTNEKEYLESLQMSSNIASLNSFNIPRVAQLSQRSNQFNLRTQRYTEADLEQMATKTEHEVLCFDLIDKFGDNGLICVVVLKAIGPHEAFIENWFMSCRVLKRGMEDFVTNSIVEKCRQRGWASVRGEFISTAKNEMVKDHYGKMGFTQLEDQWVLATEQWQDREVEITANWI
ncbi:MAG: hypothetical protein RL536_325 [Candidatus Parcubacteria bacterium]